MGGGRIQVVAMSPKRKNLLLQSEKGQIRLVKGSKNPKFWTHVGSSFTPLTPQLFSVCRWVCLSIYVQLVAFCIYYI